MRTAPREPSELLKELAHATVIGIEATYDHDGYGTDSWVTFTLQCCEGPYNEKPTKTINISGAQLSDLAEFNTGPYPASLIELTRESKDICHKWYQWENEHAEKLERYNELKEDLGL